MPSSQPSYRTAIGAEITLDGPELLGTALGSRITARIEYPTEPGKRQHGRSDPAGVLRDL